MIRRSGPYPPGRGRPAGRTGQVGSARIFQQAAKTLAGETRRGAHSGTRRRILEARKKGDRRVGTAKWQRQLEEAPKCATGVTRFVGEPPPNPSG